jgi:ubiquinone/menaquinone biosynthesis C-methylase UbiE
MRRCVYCDHTNFVEEWTCGACGYAPTILKGFRCFAPELALENSDYDPAHFDTLVKFEDGSFWFEARNRLIVWALSRFFSDSQSLLEIGVGTGFVMRALREVLPQARLSASDVHVEGLHFASRRLQNSIELFQMDAKCIPFRREFDTICLFDVLEHIQQDEAVLSELTLALKPGGGVILTVPQHMFLWGPFDEIGYHKRRYAVHELERKVKAAGFEVLLRTSFVSILLPVLYASRLRSRRAGKYNLADEQDINPLLQGLFRGLLNIEFATIRAGIRLPFGGSQLLVARLPAARG